MYVKKDRILTLFDSTDIKQCFKDIDMQKTLHEIKFDDSYDRAFRIEFDKQDKYMAIVSTTRVVILALDKGIHKPMIIQDFKIDINKYTQIHDIVLDSQNSERYFCWIACKLSGLTNIHIFDINRTDKSSIRSISYLTKGTDIVVKIADDFNKVIFSNGKEHYMLNGDNQDNFPWIKDKFLRNVINYDGSFYLACSKDYDRDIDILMSDNHKFNASFKRCIEPGLLAVYDSLVVHEKQENGEVRSIMKVLMKVGDYLYLDQLDIDLCLSNCNDMEEQGADVDGHISSTVEKHYSAYGFNWPYFSHGTKNKKVFIYNAFNPTFVQRYELPPYVTVIQATFLTDTHDAFIITETCEDMYEIFHLNLDSVNPIINSICKYSFDDVHGEILTSFHVRGSSSKEKIRLNKQLMCFMMHGDRLYCWIQTGNGLELIDEDS